MDHVPSLEFERRSRATWDREHRTGRWEYLGGPEQQVRYSCIRSLLGQFAPNAAVLDVGCGDGQLLVGGAVSPYIGIDLSEVAIRNARRRFAYRRNVRFEQCQLESFSWTPRDRIGAVIFNEVLYYVPRPLEELRRYERLARPRGALFIVSITHDKPLTWNLVHSAYASCMLCSLSIRMERSARGWYVGVFKAEPPPRSKVLIPPHG